MNNDLAQFSEERLKELVKNGLVGVLRSNEIIALARIALAAKQAKPVGYFRQMTCGIYYQLSKSTATMDQIPLYTTPQPTHTEQDGWKLVPEEATIAMLTLLGMTGSFEFMQQKYKNMLAAAPKPDGTLISEGTKNDSCQWNRDEDSVYSTGCGNEWQFTDGGLEDNQIKFCPYCSGKIAAPKPESE